MQLGVNHLGHFALTNLLLPCIRASGTARIVNVSSLAHKRGVINFDDINLQKKYSPWVAYRQSKLANVLFTKELAKKLAGSDVTTYALHPGAIKTELGRHFGVWMHVIGLLLYPLFWLVIKTPVEGAQTSIYCAVEEGIEKYSGLYFSDCAVKESSKGSCDEGVAKKLWERSENMTSVSYPL